MVASLRAGVAQTDEKFKRLQAFSFFVKGVSLPQPGLGVRAVDDRIGSTCKLISSFPVCSMPLPPWKLATKRPLWRN